jgi:hypothetical protein
VVSTPFNRIYRKKKDYTYQSIPGIHLNAKRDTGTRFNYFSHILSKEKVDFENFIVFDIGCNAGMMMHQSLVEGAYWTVGWDIEKKINSANNLLLSLGDTRFTLIPCNLNNSYSLIGSLPKFLNTKKNKVIVFFLAMRKHIEFINEFNTINWRYFFYEGHANETIQDALSFLSPFKNYSKVIGTKIEVDGDCPERPVIILKRILNPKQAFF